MQLSSFKLEKLRWLFDHPEFRRQKLRVLIRVFLWEMIRFLNAKVDVPFDGQKFSVRCTDGAGRMLYYFRSFDNEILEFVDRYLEPGQVVVDVGANIGVYTAFTAKRVAPDGHVYAFEPNPDVFERLQANVTAPNIQLFAGAVGSETGCVKLGLNPDTAKSSVVRHDVAGATVSVPCVTLDAFVRENLGERRIDYLKIDVEGFDYNVLLGARECLARKVIGFLQTECSENRTEMFQLLTDHGYRVCRLTPDRGMVPIESPENLPFNLFAFHPDIADRWIGRG